jgi:diguanylate cyclase
VQAVINGNPDSCQWVVRPTQDERPNRRYKYVPKRYQRAQNHDDPVGTTLLVAAVVALAVFTGSTVLRSRPGFNALFDSGLYSAIGAIAAVLVGRRARVVDDERGAWIAATFALVAFTIGNLANGLFFAGLDNPPVPSLADVAWLGFYPFAYVMVIGLIRTRHKQALRSMWLDGASGGAGLAAIAAAVAFGPISAAAKGTNLAVAVNLAYPMADLLLVVLIGCAFAMEGWRPSRSWLLIGTGILMFAIADTVYLFRVAADNYVEGTPFDALWPLGALLLAIAARGSHVQTERQSPRQRLSVVIVPATFSLLSVGLLFADHFHPFSSVAAAFAGVSVLAGLVRFGLTFREVQSLALSRREARTDELTALGNRRDFLERAADRLALLGVNNATNANHENHENHENSAISLLLLDLNRFKEVNDSLGHDVGDELLRQVARRLEVSVQSTDLLARLGGDEFAVLLDNADPDVAMVVATRLAERIGASMQLDGMEIQIGASIGIACAPQHGETVPELLKHADIAMYDAKRSGLAHTVFAPDLHQNTRERMETIEELRHGINDRQLVVFYQPTIDASSETVAGVEALVRWNHPRRGFLLPADFIPLAEQAGLMGMLTDAVLGAVLCDLVRWRDEAQLVLRCSINLSVANLLDEGFPDRVRHALRRHTLPASSLVFEITENILLSDPDRAKRSVCKLRDLGARVSLDDYGTGYSSMAYLRQLPLDELKLDRSFAADLANDPAAITFISTAKQLADALGLKLVAEGIETAAMWEQVRSIGCDLGQGFYFARPMPAAELLEFLATRSAVVT